MFSMFCFQGECSKVKKIDENPFAIEIPEGDLSNIYEKVNHQNNNQDDNNSTVNNAKANISKHNNNDLEESSSNGINNTSKNNNNVNNNNNTETQNTPVHQISNTPKPTNGTSATNAVGTTTNNTNDNKNISKQKQIIKKQTTLGSNQSKPPLRFSKPSTKNHIIHDTKSNEVSRHCSTNSNQKSSNIKGKTSRKICKSEKSHASTNIPGKGPKTQPLQNSTKHKGTSVDKQRTSTGRNTIGSNGAKNGSNPRQSNPKVSVKDLEQILGVNVTELREVIKKFKSEENGTNEESGGQCTGQGNLGSPEMAEDHKVGSEKVQDGCKDDQMKTGRRETMDNKGLRKYTIHYHDICPFFDNTQKYILDEISSDSGVSEPDAHSTDGQPRYITLKTILKRKEYLEGQLRKLEERVVAMEDHRKDIQFVHDLFDLHGDGLAKVERSTGGVACVTSLKKILGGY